MRAKQLSLKANHDVTVPFYEIIEGAGAATPWIVMVHGASQHSGIFCAQVDAFRCTHRLLLVDLPGHGRSTDMPGPYGLAGYAQGVMAAIDDSGVDTFHFWGTHTGAGIGLLLASRHPERFISLVLDGAVLPGVDLPYVTMAIARAKATARERGVEAACTEWFQECEWFDVIRARPQECRAREHRDMIAGFSGRPWLDTLPPTPVAPLGAAMSRITLPVLLINGQHDVDDFVRVADQLAGALPFVTREVIPGAGGFPLWECPAEVNQIVGRFILQHTAQGCSTMSRVDTRSAQAPAAGTPDERHP